MIYNDAHKQARTKLTSPPGEKNTLTWQLFNSLTSMAPSSFLFSRYFFIISPVSSSDGCLLLPDLFPSCSQFLLSIPLYSDCCIALLLPTPSLGCFLLASSAPVGAFSVNESSFSLPSPCHYSPPS